MVGPSDQTLGPGGINSLDQAGNRLVIQHNLMDGGLPQVTVLLDVPRRRNSEQSLAEGRGVAGRGQ